MSVARILRLCFVVLLSSCGSRSELRGVADDASAPEVRVDVPCVRTDGPVCGNGCIDPGETCDDGPLNARIPAFSLRRMNQPDLPVFPVRRSTTPVLFYRYESASAHTGFEEIGMAQVFLYVNTNTNGLSFFFVAGQDDQGTGVLQPDAEGTATFEGFPQGTRVLLSDDQAELSGLDAMFSARWTFQQNSDGGVLGELSWDRAWTLTMRASFVRGIDRFRYVQSDGTFVPLRFGEPILLIHAIAPSTCSTECQRPRCGDGYVDGGERCDDGNNIDRDGCSADCRRIE